MSNPQDYYNRLLQALYGESQIGLKINPEYRGGQQFDQRHANAQQDFRGAQEVPKAKKTKWDFDEADVIDAEFEVIEDPKLIENK